MTSLSVYLWVPDRKLNIIEEILLQHPFSYLLRAPSESCTELVMPAELSAARGWKQSWENMQMTVQHSQADRRQEREREGRDGRKALGLESGALRQSLNKAGEKERNTGRRESKRAAGPGLHRTHRQLLLDCLLQSDRATPHISTPLHYTLLSSEKWPPISPSPQRKPPIQFLSFFTSPTTWAQVHSAT